MDDWHAWDDFLHIISARHNLAKTETNIFLTCFARENIEKTDDALAEEMMVGFDSYRKTKSRVYRKFAEDCPEIDHGGRGKFRTLLTWLEESYQQWLDIPGKEPSPSPDTSHFPSNSPTKTAHTNPFIPLNGVIDQPELFFDRYREIQRIFELLNNRSSVSVVGERAIGKSSLLKAICRQAATKLEIPRQPVYINLQYLENESDFYAELCEKLSIPEQQGFQLTRQLRKCKLLLVLDEVEKMTWDGFSRQIRAHLRGLAEGAEAPLRLIFASCDSLYELFKDAEDEGMTSPLAGICIEERLEPWDEETAEAFIHHRLKPTQIRFSQAEITDLINTSGGHPQKLMQMCHQTYANYLHQSS